jgi:hypothetical protein
MLRPQVIEDHADDVQRGLAGLAVRRGAVSSVGHALQRAGIISYSRVHIEITNVQGLSETSCECSHAVKVRPDRLMKAPDCDHS